MLRGAYTDPSAMLYYLSDDSPFYHRVADCTQMQNAEQVSAQAIIEDGHPACPICPPEASPLFWQADAADPLHTDADCAVNAGEPVQADIPPCIKK